MKGHEPSKDVSHQSRISIVSKSMKQIHQVDEFQSNRSNFSPNRQQRLNLFALTPNSFSFLLFFISKFFAFQMCFVIIVLNHTMAHTRSNSQWLCLSLERKKYGFFVDDKFMYWISETENWILLNLMDFEMIFLPWLYRSSLERK